MASGGACGGSGEWSCSAALWLAVAWAWELVGLAMLWTSAEWSAMPMSSACQHHSNNARNQLNKAHLSVDCGLTSNSIIGSRSLLSLDQATFG